MQHIKYFLNRLSLKGKLNLFQGTVAVGMLLIFVASWWGITMLSRTAEIRKQIFEDEFLALKLKNETEQWAVLTYGYLYRKNPEHLKDHKILGQRVKKQADALIKKEIIFFKSSLFGVSGADENMVAETNRLFSQRDKELKKVFKDLDKLLELGSYMTGKSSGQTDVSAYENLFIHHRMAFNQGLDKWMKSLIETSADVSKAGALMQKEVLTWVLFWIIALQISLFVLGRNTVFAVTGGLDYLRKIGQRIAEGDLRIQSRVRAKNDEIGNVIEVFGSMTESLKDIVSKIQGVGGKLVNSSDNLSTVAEDISESTQKTASSINQVASGVSEQSRSASDAASLVEQIALAIDQVAKGAQDQAREINETHNSVAELSEAVTQVSQSANHVSTTVKESSEIAGKGEDAVAETISGMNRIKEVVEESAHKIEALGEKSQQIGDIVEVIDDIAEQTNLLALNAAIEAARAGEHGKGFAVVAEEVRKLAERSTNATKEIANLIQSIQNEMIDAVKAMQTGTEEVEKGSQLADKAGASLREIISSVELVVNQIKDVSSATDRMTHLAQNTTKAIDNIAAVTEENTASTQEVAASTDQVVQSITTIAAISQETAASAQSVSAFTESQASKVQEMAVSAQELALLAEDLRMSVTHFVIEDSEGTDSGNNSESILKKLDTPCEEKEDQALLSGKKIS